jgi:hypothetical protein
LHLLYPGGCTEHREHIRYVYEDKREPQRSQPQCSHLASFLRVISRNCLISLISFGYIIQNRVYQSFYTPAANFVNFLTIFETVSRSRVGLQVCLGTLLTNFLVSFVHKIVIKNVQTRYICIPLVICVLLIEFPPLVSAGLRLDFGSTTSFQWDLKYDAPHKVLVALETSSGCRWVCPLARSSTVPTIRVPSPST